MAVENGASKRSLYSGEWNKLFCIMDCPLPFKISLDTNRCNPQDFKMVTTMAYTDSMNADKAVIRCSNHIETEKKLGT